MDLIPVKNLFPMVTVRRNEGFQIKFYTLLIWEAFMDRTYGPCWRCEGMGV